MAPRGGQPTCTLCHDPDNRRTWGCDEPAAEAVTRITPCYACQGMRDDCDECRGTNEVDVFECPNRLVHREHQDAVLAIVQMEHGILPAPGGLYDQSATFVEAVPLLMREVAHWRDVAIEQARREAAKGR